MNKVLIKNLKVKKLQTKDVSDLYLKTINSPLAKQFIEYSKKNKKITKTDLKKYINFQNSQKSLFLGVFHNEIHIGNIKISYVGFGKFMIGFLVFNGFRGRGIIKKIFKKIFRYKFFKLNNISKIYLGVDKKNKNAIKLYEQLGFKKQKKNKMYVLNIRKLVQNY